MMGDEKGVAAEASRTLVAICKRLDIAYQGECKESFCKRIVGGIDELARCFHGFVNLKIMLRRPIIGARDAHAPRA